MQLTTVIAVLTITVLVGYHPTSTQQQYDGDGHHLSASVSTPATDVDTNAKKTEKKRQLKQIQEEYEAYLLKHTAVIEVHFESSWQIWVRLKASKYTSKSNVEQIAKTIASGYAAQTGEDAVVCTVWSYDAKRVYAKGYYSSR